MAAAAAVAVVLVAVVTVVLCPKAIVAAAVSVVVAVVAASTAGRLVDLGNAALVAERSVPAAGDEHSRGEIDFNVSLMNDMMRDKPEKFGVAVVESHAAETGLQAEAVGGTAVGEGDPVLEPELFVFVSLVALVPVPLLVQLQQQQ